MNHFYTHDFNLVCSATGGIASQSSQWDTFGDANNAIDLNWTNRYLEGSCNHKKAEINPWWRVDLSKTHNVTYVTITNRGDCCSDRISGAEIHVGDSLPAFNCPQDSCYSSKPKPSLAVGSSEIPQKTCYSERGLLPLEAGRAEFLIGSSLKNNGNSNPHHGAARNAIDRKRNPLYHAGSCSHTKAETNPWWRVDLLDTYQVTITNRGDCCLHRINGAEINIGDSLENNGTRPIHCEKDKI
ncbi:unnamed protein product [Coregonus sp. 'balchen']|nr:unnamed protein product [Coregonus sp. 'balchen']